jgi:hypothetical protein
MNHKLALLLGLAVLPACKKDKPADSSGGGSAAGGTTGGTTAKPVENGSGPFAVWDMAGRKAAFQGAMVGPGGAVGLWEAWNVEGDKITVWDGKTEQVAELSLPSPCEATVTVKGADGSSSGTTHHYTIENGQIVTGLGDAGSRKGDSAVACVSNKVVTLEGGTCLEWEQDMFDKTKYKSAPGTCGFAKDGDKDVFKATVNGSESTLEIHGDAMYTAQIAQAHSEKAADWAAAKAARDAKK